MISSVLSILFPALNISHPKGKYNVGIVDLYLPVKFDKEHAKIHKFDMASKTTQTDGYVSVRLYYPTLDLVKPIPYFNENVGKTICEALVTVCAPEPLNHFKFILHTWLFCTINAKRNAKLIPGKDTLPSVVFSHGIAGNMSVYSYQCMSLASNGYIVLGVEHTDKTTIAMYKHDGTYIPYDLSIVELEKKDECQYIRARRKQADHRGCEMIAATQSFMQLHEQNVDELEKVGVSFKNRLDINRIAIGGHSFGSGGAITAATKKPELYSCVIAHDPTIDWTPDYVRKQLFLDSKFERSKLKYVGGTAGYESTQNDDDSCVYEEGKREDSASRTKMSIHDLNLFFLFSNEWVTKGLAASPFVFDMFQRGQLAQQKTIALIALM
eukprot:CAMPEP_0178941890 /NCGR_PEP_ID=MMETSP0789-20121207/1672_1 /TAXON_ID=3005 /ORGANISM="Rhizosolenia setigera, Strain CCMP 1694" /LENGTH=381 /DNA_ID=CAMNT_0020621203 /DNA_START=445 /DNA_END=1591 /DNA_ORIENTATION=+